MLEKDLFPPLKKHFKELGFKVFAEVPSNYRGIDFVAVKEGHHIAVEMKLSFNKKVIQQARENWAEFNQTYVAFPVKKPIFFHGDNYDKLSDKLRQKCDWCNSGGIGILEVLPHGTIFEALESQFHDNLWRVRDFSEYVENDYDEAGLPYQKGVSEGYMELKAIKKYVRKNPTATWKEIYANVSNHYSSPSSMSGSMSSWRGFILQDFKNEIAKENGNI